MSDQGWFPSFQVSINSAYTNNKDKLIVPRAYNCYMSLVSASFPVSWYNVPTGSNTLSFLYRINGEASNRTFVLTIPPGWYSSTELANSVAWSGNIAGVLPAIQLSVIGCIYLENQNKFQFIFRPMPQVLFFSLAPSPLALAMGFSTNLTSAMVASAGSSFVDANYKQALICTGDLCADLSSVRNIHVQTNFRVRQFASGTQTLAVIPVTQPFGGVVQYQNINNVDRLRMPAVCSRRWPKANALNLSVGCWCLMTSDPCPTPREGPQAEFVN
jgi:hypothetical protein